MRTGFVGAGKAGFSLGRYLADKGNEISGYASRSRASAGEAAAFTDSKAYDTVKDLVKDSDILFLSVPDGKIATVWNEIRDLPIEGKLICHLSGAMTSRVFDKARDKGACGYSVHPFLAISDRYTSHMSFEKALFTIEGDAKRIDEITGFLEACGNPVQRIDASQKGRYHMAATIASNFMVTLYDVAQKELLKCGFLEENLPYALPALVGRNIESVIERGPADALTGPVERGDVLTVRKHLELADDDLKALYTELARRTLVLAKEKNPDRDYLGLEELLS